MNPLHLEFKEMCFYYEGAEILFANVNYRFPTSKVIRICSRVPGKSTLLKILAGVSPVSSGEFLIDGKNVGEMSFEEFLPLRLKIGYGFDSGGLINNKTLIENIILPLQYHNRGSQHIEGKVQMLLERFKLERVQHLRPFAVSGSLRKATCLVRSIVLEPEILILDEPDAGLKDDGVVALCKTLEEELERGLRQVIYTSDNPILEKRLGPVDVWLEMNRFEQKRIAA